MNNPTTDEARVREHLQTVTMIKAQIKELGELLTDALKAVETDIDLGLLDEYEDEGSYVFENIRCTVYQTERYEYTTELKEYIKEMQERQRYSGEAVKKITTAMRFKTMQEES